MNDAVAEVEHNGGDMAEGGIYNYAVIEEFASGLYPRVISEIWFCWNGERYQSCDKPKGTWSSSNWGLG